jgi:hypothetical protein
MFFNTTQRHQPELGRAKPEELVMEGFMSRFAPHRNVSACALIALALVGCGSETATSTDGAGTAETTTPATTGGAAGAVASASGSSATKPAASGTTTPSSTSAAPAGSAPATTPPAGATTTPPAGAATTPPASAPTTPPTDPAAPPPAGGATPPTTSTDVELPVEMGTPTLFWLQIETNAAYTANADGSGQKVFATGSPMSAPDGVAVDTKDGWVYVLNMGSVLGGSNSGSLVRYKLDGSSPETIMPARSMADGETFNTGKQVSMDKVNRKLYMGDREGSKVWRCDMDGKNLEVLISGHDIQQVVGVSPDPIAKQFYFSDRNGKKLFRAGMEMPAGKTHADRDDVELLYTDKAGNAMPLDIELDVKDRVMFWTDRQQNKVFSMPMDMPAGMDGNTRTDVKTVASGLTDVIGLGYDHEAKVLYATHSGTVSSFKADGSDMPKRIGTNGRTGLVFTKLP